MPSSTSKYWAQYSNHPTTRPALLSGPVRHHISSGPIVIELRWWIRCPSEHLMLIDENQVLGKEPIYCQDCNSSFVEDFSTRAMFNRYPRTHYPTTQDRHKR